MLAYLLAEGERDPRTAACTPQMPSMLAIRAAQALLGAQGAPTGGGG